MKKILLKRINLLMLLALADACLFAQNTVKSSADYYVSTEVNDIWSGKLAEKQIPEKHNTIADSSQKDYSMATSNHFNFIGEAINEPGYDIWGSSPIRDKNGSIHIFCARWPSSIPFWEGWRNNSEIAHYISNQPEGPFRLVKVIGKGKGEGYWNAKGFHNPNIKKIDGKYVLVYIANDGSPKPGPIQRIGMLVSESLDGPWQEIPNKKEPLLSAPSDSSKWCYKSGCGVTNPTLLKHPDGRYFLYFKSMSGPRPAGKLKMGLAIADKLEGPYIIQSEPATNNELIIEDGYAFIWRDHICLMTTDNQGILENGGGLLWVSKDGLKFDKQPLSGFHHFGNYYLKGNIPPNANVRYTNQIKFERPQLLFDDDGGIDYMYCPCPVALDGSDGTNCYVLKFRKND